MSDTDASSQQFSVLINHEEQYSLWPEWKAVPAGWRVVKSGDRASCLQFVEEQWTDMRPLSLRKRMDGVSA